MVKIIKEIIFGVRREPVEHFSTGFHSLYPVNPPSYEEWCKEFHVSMMHGKQINHLN